MIDEFFSHGHSYLHRADPRAKVAAAFALALCIAPLSHLYTAAAALMLSVSLVIMAHLPVAAVMRRLALINIFTLFLWLTLPFTTPPMQTSDILATFGPLTMSIQGIHTAALITLKSNAIILALMALAATSGITEIGHAMASIGVPQKFAMLLLFTWRYLHVIADEYARLLRAATMRGFVPTSSRRTYATYANLIAMVLVRSYDRSTRVQQAMALRGFHGVMHRLYDFTTAPHDRIFLSLTTLVAVGILLCDCFLLH